MGKKSWWEKNKTIKIPLPVYGLLVIVSLITLLSWFFEDTSIQQEEDWTCTEWKNEDKIFSNILIIQESGEELACLLPC